MKNFFYKPRISIILIDFLIWSVGLLFLLFWRVVAEKSVIADYGIFVSIMFAFWFVVSIPLQRYRYYKQDKTYLSFVYILIAAIFTGLFSLAIQLRFYQHLSLDVIFWELVIVTSLLSVFTLGYYAYRYAAWLDEDIQEYDEREPKQVLKEPRKLKEERIQTIKRSILEHTNQETFNFIAKHVDLTSTNTLIGATSGLFNFQSIENYRFDAIVNLWMLNNIKGINKIFCEVNNKLPDKGLFVCCFESLEMHDQRIKEKYPVVIRNIVSFLNFVTKRLLPKLLITSRLWLDVTGGQNRVFSETEILGRLYYCGFEVIDRSIINDKCWVVARRKKQPDKQINKRYGLIIKLPRIGKNKKVINYYKMRTMHPYSEYIQKYVYDNCGTDDGDKAKNDFRITKWGAFFRKVWIDELPMLFNLIKGDMKLVGVRPLSKTKFETYPEYLQEKRTKAKPGLFPPFYVDLPKTQEEMFESENKYMEQYLKAPRRTDFIYFNKSLYNILVKKARSQ